MSDAEFPSSIATCQMWWDTENTLWQIKTYPLTSAIFDTFPHFSPLLQQIQSLFASFDTFFSRAIFLLCVGTWILFDYKRIKHSTTLKTVFLFSMLFLLYFFYVPLQWLLTYQAHVFVFFKWSRSPDSTGNRGTAWTEEPTVTLNSAW